jgi:hypothetical protein
VLLTAWLQQSMSIAVVVLAGILQALYVISCSYMYVAASQTIHVFGWPFRSLIYLDNIATMQFYSLIVG